MKSAVRSFLCLAIIFLPVYLFSSGGLQISHLFIVVASLVVAASGRIRVDFVQLFLILLAVFVFCRESFWVFGGGSYGGLLNAAFIMFSAITVTVFGSSFGRVLHVRDIYNCCLISSFLAFAAVLVGGGGPLAVGAVGRSTGLFNNPNQLGYFAVCIFSIAACFLFQAGMSKGKVWCLLILSLSLAAASLSKAAMISVGAGFFLFVIFNSNNNKSVIVSLFSLVLVFGVVSASYFQGAIDEYSAVKRLQDIGKDKDDSLLERGYGALSEANALEWFVGLGYEKTVQVVGHEVHSTIFSFFVTYGIIGGILFSIVMGVWFHRVWRGNGVQALLVICMPPMLYGITHNGSRFTIFWLVVALSYYISSSASKKNVAHFGRRENANFLSFDNGE